MHRNQFTRFGKHWDVAESLTTVLDLQKSSKDVRGQGAQMVPASKMTLVPHDIYCIVQYLLFVTQNTATCVRLCDVEYLLCFGWFQLQHLEKPLLLQNKMERAYT